MMKKKPDAFTIPKTVMVELTREEIDALGKYSAKREKARLEEVFSAVEELLEARYRIEDTWAGMCKEDEDRSKYIYGRHISELLIIDLKQMKKKYLEEEG